MHELLASGSWQEVRKLHKPAAAKQGRLKNTEGIVINSSERADTFAKYLESVQWAVRPLATITHDPPLFDALPVDESNIMDEEICMVLKKLHQKKAPGHDNLNPEFWKVCANSTKIVQWIAALCNRVFILVIVPRMEISDFRLEVGGKSDE